MPAYAPELSLRDGRERYFLHAGFDSDGYSDRWVRLKAGPFTFMFPNTAARVRAVKLHDLHHVLTEYDTTWTGEAEIAGWEIASGCGRHYAAWVLNLCALAIGLAIAPRKSYRAFVSGLHSRNLYGTEFSEALLDRRIGEVRQELPIRAQPVATLPDIFSFALWGSAALAVSIAPWLLGLVAVRVLLRRFLSRS